MSIIKFRVDRSSWSDDVIKMEFSKETDHFYMHARGRGREAKDSRWFAYFDTREEANEYIQNKKEKEKSAKAKMIASSFSMELLYALEGMVSLFPDGAEDDGSGMLGFNENLKSKYRAAVTAITKAKGEAK